MIYNLLLRIYNFIFYIIAIFSLGFLFGKTKDKIKQRLLLNKKLPLTGSYIWLHGASVGEILSAKVLINSLLDKNDIKILITSHTETSKNIIKNNFDERVFHHYLPYDCGYLVKKFLKRYKPFLVLWLEQDFFPVFFNKINKNKIPLLLLNARMSDTSFQRWSNLKFIISHILDYFKAIYPMSVNDKNKLDFFNNKDNKFIGNLKYTNIVSKEKVLNKFSTDIVLLNEYLKDSLVFTALSTHKNEENIVSNLHEKLKEINLKIKTIIIPRHIARVNDILKEFTKNNIKVTLFSELASSVGQTQNTEIILVDSMGKATLFCALSDITFIGKSLYLKGGHNLLEPLSVGCPVIFGKNMNSFKDIVADTLKNRAGIEVANKEELFTKLSDVFKNKELLRQLKSNTSFIQKEKDDILKNFLGEIDCYLKI